MRSPQATAPAPLDKAPIPLIVLAAIGSARSLFLPLRRVNESVYGAHQASGDDRDHDDDQAHYDDRGGDGDDHDDGDRE